ncbi:unnamed protein product [Cladocopium goreaui]|uniref:Uncharacterized protein n=1 Tax=Cladocopium goreaui TaxID=2562237 RepID=A0A9P1C667_9DINO|nr:unnamed protein product [Cladocopium goreaui]
MASLVAVGYDFRLRSSSGVPRKQGAESRLGPEEAPCSGCSGSFISGPCGAGPQPSRLEIIRAYSLGRGSMGSVQEPTPRQGCQCWRWPLCSWSTFGLASVPCKAGACSSGQPLLLASCIALGGLSMAGVCLPVAVARNQGRCRLAG